MEELRKLLNNIDDSYFEFVSAMEHYAQKNAASQCELWTDNSDAPYMEKHDSTFRYSEEAKLANVAEGKTMYTISKNS